MPELAEVEYGRRIAEAVARGRRITAVWCDNDPIVFEGVTPEEMGRALTGATVLGVHRHGKQLWMALDRRPWPLFHFGMTGAFRTPGDAPLELESSPKDGEDPWPPRFAKIRLTFEGGGQLVMTNKRRLGRIRLRDRPLEEPPLSRLGFDPLTGMPPEDDFVARLRRRRTALKAVLLDQKFAAGIGNWLADEICYQARLDPRRRAADLSAAEAARVRATMARIVEQAVAVNAVKAEFPDDWLFHRRWGRPDDAETHDGHPIEVIEVAGRTTAWVPALQR